MKRLQFPLDQAKKAADRQLAKREALVASATQYKDIEDARNAYGWGFITEEEFDTIYEIFERGEATLAMRSPEEMAYDILKDMVNGLNHDIAGFEFELLPAKEQQRILAQNAEILERRNKRRLNQQ